MLVSLWSAKAGAGCTTIALGLAHAFASRRGACLIIDLGGDVTAAAGVDEPTVGVTDWLAESPGDADALGRLELGTDRSGVSVIGVGTATDWSPEADAELSSVLRREARPVVVDVGHRFSSPTPALTRVRDQLAAWPDAVFVVRPGYLEVHRALRHRVRPERIALVRENGRALDRFDVTRLLGAPVVAQVDLDPRVARVSDSGRLLTNAPRTFIRQVEELVS